MEKALNITFYGNTFVPLSTDCSGCHFFNYECEGSVFRGECPIDEVQDMTDSEKASKTLVDERVNGNFFILARINGIENLEQHLEMLKEKIKDNPNAQQKQALESSAENLIEAIETDETIIQALRNDYL